MFEHRKQPLLSREAFFAGTYALYSGLTLILTMGVIVAPIVHRFFHKFHLDVKDA